MARSANSRVYAGRTVLLPAHRSAWLLPFLLVALAILSACSTRFLYNQLDSIIVWRINGLVDLNDAQEAELKQRVGRQLDSLRLDVMPKAADLMEQVAVDIESGRMDQARLEQRYAEMLSLSDDFLADIVSLSQWLLRSLDAEQVDELFASLEEINQESYDDFSGATEEERKRNRDKSVIKITQRFTGRLSKEQKALVSGALAEMSDASEEWISYQRQWQQRLRELVESDLDDASFRAELTELFINPRSLHSPEFRATVDSNRTISNRMIADLFASLDDSQKARAVDKIRGYADTLNRLAERPERPSAMAY